MFNEKKAKIILILLIGLMAGILTAGPYLQAQMAPGTINAKQSGTWIVQPGNTANSTAWLVTGTGGTFPVTGTFYQATQPVSIAATVNTAPGGLGTFASSQVAVTASAATIGSSTTTSNVCVKALVGNTINVYLGASGVTTATGFELAPGDTLCQPVNNLNLIYVIASTTGASISYVYTH